jgi:hypothetical protein
VLQGLKKFAAPPNWTKSRQTHAPFSNIYFGDQLGDSFWP